MHIFTITVTLMCINLLLKIVINRFSSILVTFAKNVLWKLLTWFIMKYYICEPF